ncbi:putative ribonuclease H-like domain-containing protein, partial [Tanacetum coccineum]
NIAGSGPNWLFDINALTKSMNYEPVVAGNQSNGNAGTKACDDAGKARMETIPGKDYILLPLWPQDLKFSFSSKDSYDAGFKPSKEEEKKDAKHPGNKDSEVPSTKEPRVNQEKENDVDSTNNLNTVSSTVNAATLEDNAAAENIVYVCADDPNMPNLEEIVYSNDDEGVGAEADMTNLNIFMPVSPILTTRLHKDHPIEQIIGDIHLTPQTRRMTKSVTEHVEPKKVIQALIDPRWIEAMQDELLQFKLQKVWTLVDLPYGKKAIRTKWVYRNKKDERGIMVRNKARLVAQGYTQEEGINYDEVFALVARIEAIRMFLAYDSFVNFVVYQMDVKSAFLYGKIEEDVYVYQPPGFEDLEFPDKVYKVEKALYGLHQAPRAWYETLSTYLLDNGFQRGQIDKTLFIKRFKGDILLVQVYVDDIIFGSIRKELCTEFEKLMHKRFQMSSKRELTFFLGLQVMQKDDGIFISQDKYVDEILKKFGFLTMKIASTPMETSKPLLKDENAKYVDVNLYRSMIGSLMYLTSSKPDIIYLKCQPKLGLWYPKDSPFDLEAYSDNDYAGAIANSTTEAEYVAAASCYRQDTPSHPKNVLANMRSKEKIFQDCNTLVLLMLIQSQAVEGEGSGQPTEPQDTPTTTLPSHVEPIPIVASSSQPKKTQKHRKTKRKATEISQSSGPPTIVAYETVHEERGENVEKAALNCNLNLDAEQASGGSPRCQEAMRNTIAQTRSERVSIPSYDSDSPGSQECSSFGNSRVEEKSQEVGKEEKVKNSTTQEEVIQGQDKFQEDSETQGRYGYDIGVNTASTSNTTTSINITTVEPVTTASAPVTTAGVSMKSEKSKAKGVTIQEPSKSGTRVRVPPPQIDPKDKGKAKMVEPKKPKKKKDQIEYDADVAQRLQAELDEEARLERERKVEASKAANITEWDDVQAMIDADYELAAKLQAKESILSWEQGEISIEERSKLYVELMNERKKHFARLKAEEQRRKPPTKTQKRNLMSYILK